MIKAVGKYFISAYEAIRAIDDSFTELSSGQIYDLPKNNPSKDRSCRNCGAPLKSCICEYCGTVY